MFLTDDSTAVSALPTPAAAGTPGYFSDGNPTTGTPATILRADFMNMLQGELNNVVVAGGLTPSKTTYNQVLTSINTLIANAKKSVVGSMRNGRCVISTASASAVFTADEIIVQTSLSGASYQLSSFNKTINLATTGAGGMDTGSAPASGFVSLYAIYNPTTGASSILAVSTTSTLSPEIYGGSSMPTGYTASALIGVRATNSSSQFSVSSQFDRIVTFAPIQAFTINNGVSASISGSISLVGILPVNAFTCFGNLRMTSLGSATNYGFGVSGVNNVGLSGLANYANASFADLFLATPQTLQYGVGTGSSSVNVSLDINGYRF